MTASQSKPPKRQRAKSKRLNVNQRTQWERLLKDVKKEEIPVAVLDSLRVNLIDGTSILIDIKELLQDGNDPADIEFELQAKLTALNDLIEDVDFYIDVDSVTKTVQPITDQILKGL
jgi:hypothetical protein